MGTDDNASDIHVDAVVGFTYQSCFVRRGTTIGDALRKLWPNVDELLTSGSHLSRAFPGDKSISEASVYEPIEQDVCLFLTPRMEGARELGKDELADALNAILFRLSKIEHQLDSVRQLRTDLNYLQKAFQALAANVRGDAERRR